MLFYRNQRRSNSATILYNILIISNLLFISKLRTKGLLRAGASLALNPLPSTARCTSSKSCFRWLASFLGSQFFVRIGVVLFVLILVVHDLFDVAGATLCP